MACAWLRLPAARGRLRPGLRRFLEQLVEIGRFLALALEDRGAALLLLRRFVFRLGDVGGDRDDHFRMQGDADLVQAERLDRLVEDHLAAIDGEAGGGHAVRDVAVGDRAEQHAGLARLADDDDLGAVHLLGDLLGFLLALEVGRFDLRALRLETLLVIRGRAQGLLARQQEVAREARLHGDHVPDLAQLLDALQQNDVHGALSLSSARRAAGPGSARA